MVGNICFVLKTILVKVRSISVCDLVTTFFMHHLPPTIGSVLYGSTWGFLCINICHVRREILKTEGNIRGFKCMIVIIT